MGIKTILQNVDRSWNLKAETNQDELCKSE
jgi:hypothetical protein